MKIREFKLENYVDNIKEKMKQLLSEDIGKDRLGVTISINRVSIREIEDAGWNDKDKVAMEVLDKFSKKDEVIKAMESLYQSKSDNVVKAFDKQKEYADKILFDDKDYLELLTVLEDNYYCQALTMLHDMVARKTKGTSVKAMKYQARKMQADDISCD